MSYLTAAQVSDPGFKYRPGNGLSTPSEVNLAVEKAYNGNFAPLASLLETQGITIEQVPEDLKNRLNDYIKFSKKPTFGGRRKSRKSRKTRRRRHGRKTRRSRK
jgi:hypothetical protein